MGLCFVCVPWYFQVVGSSDTQSKIYEAKRIYREPTTCDYLGPEISSQSASSLQLSESSYVCLICNAQDFNLCLSGKMEKSVSNTCVTHMELWVRFPMLADKDRNYPVPSVGAAAIRGFYQKHLLIRTQPSADLPTLSWHTAVSPSCSSLLCSAFPWCCFDLPLSLSTLLFPCAVAEKVSQNSKWRN